MIKVLPLPDEPRKAYYLEDWDKAKGYTQPLPFAKGKSITLGVDDALAIMLATYCHKQDFIDILAITCTHGNTAVDNVCKNVCYTLRACDLEVL